MYSSCAVVFDVKEGIVVDFWYVLRQITSLGMEESLYNKHPWKGQGNNWLGWKWILAPIFRREKEREQFTKILIVFLARNRTGGLILQHFLQFHKRYVVNMYSAFIFLHDFYIM